MPFNILKIDQVLSFLDIAFSMNIISEMNCSILRKEFLELNQSIKESTGNVQSVNRQINLTEFFREPARPPEWSGAGGELSSKGHLPARVGTRIGVQKGSTLMRALSDKLNSKVRPNTLDLTLRPASNTQEFNLLKKQRRNDIINIIKNIGGNATIKDIKDKAQTSQDNFVSLVSCSEKTLQRELVSMVKDSVLNKVGEKRWSRYQIRG